jgi:hypothetical protein
VEEKGIIQAIDRELRDGRNAGFGKRWNFSGKKPNNSGLFYVGSVVE